MEYFLALPRYPFKEAVFRSAPEDPGIAGLFDGNELLCVVPAKNIKLVLRDIQKSVFGKWHVQATHYTWHISMFPGARCREVLKGFLELNSVPPKFQHFVPECGHVYSADGKGSA